MGKIVWSNYENNIRISTCYVLKPFKHSRATKYWKNWLSILSFFCYILCYKMIQDFHEMTEWGYLKAIIYPSIICIASAEEGKNTLKTQVFKLKTILY